jgi:uncharacterized membrane protein
MTDRGKTMLLVGSLLCNGLLVGFILGELRGETFTRTAMVRAQETSTIPAAVDTVIAGAFDTERLIVADALREARAAQDEAADVIRRDPMDLDRLDRSLARIRAADDVVLTSIHRALRSAAAKLDPRGRDVVADVIGQAPPGGRVFAQQYRWPYLRRLVF